MNEENGVVGARTYAQEHASDVADHFAAIESTGRPSIRVCSRPGTPEFFRCWLRCPVLGPSGATLMKLENVAIRHSAAFSRGVPLFGPWQEGAPTSTIITRQLIPSTKWNPALWQKTPLQWLYWLMRWRTCSSLCPAYSPKKRPANETIADCVLRMRIEKTRTLQSAIGDPQSSGILLKQSTESGVQCHESLLICGIFASSLKEIKIMSPFWLLVLVVLDCRLESTLASQPKSKSKMLTLGSRNRLMSHRLARCQVDADADSKWACSSIMSGNKRSPDSIPPRLHILRAFTYRGIAMISHLSTWCSRGVSLRSVKAKSGGATRPALFSHHRAKSIRTCLMMVVAVAFWLRYLRLASSAS